MAKLKVIVSSLNKRRAPVVDFADKSNIIGTIFKGQIFESTGEIKNKLGSWYTDRDGVFYWGEGLEDISSQNLVAPFAGNTSPSFDPLKMSWGHKMYGIPFLWDDLKTKGKGVVIAVIDTGIDINHTDLISNIHPLSISLVDGNISDADGHGTQMAGIIAASGKSKVFGVAPEARLIIIKATNDGSGNDLQKFIDAVDYLSALPEVDIVSISYSFITSKSDQQKIKQLQQLQQSIQKAMDNNKIVVASIGDLRTVVSPPEDRDTFPACFNTGLPEYKGVIAVGAFDSNKNLCDFSNHNKHLCLLAPGDREVLTANINNSTTNGGQTSIAAAFVSGCLALMISYAKENKPGKNIDYVRALFNTCDDIGEVIGPDVSNGYGFMNLRNALSKIKNI